MQWGRTVGLPIIGAVCLAGCGGVARRPGWAEPGVAVVGRITRVEQVSIWTGDVEGSGHIFWLETGPPVQTIPFGSHGDCPLPIVSDQRYLVMLTAGRYGYSAPNITAADAPWLYAIACTRIDPEVSEFPAWRPQP